MPEGKRLQKSKKRVLVSSRSFGSISETGKLLLENNGFVVQFIPPEARPLDGGKLAQICSEEKPDVLICGSEPISKDLFRICPRLKMVMKHGVGTDNIDIKAATDFHVTVANAPGTNTTAVAELTVGLILALLRRIYWAVNSTKHGAWNRYVGDELGSITVGVIGTGKIGSAVVKLLVCFGTKVLVYDIVRNENLRKMKNVSYVGLEELLRDSDVVTLHIPLSENTRHIIGRDELKLMKTSAYLVNVARGELVDEEALIEQLNNDLISGAAVDVYSVEPPQNSLLTKTDRVLPTPHIAAYTNEAMINMDTVCAQTIIDALDGKVIPNILNPTVITKTR